MYRIWLITGDPGVGKTTVLHKAVNILRAQGFTVGGMISREVRTSGERIGFQLVDIGSGRTGTLASKHLDAGPRIGRYRVNLRDLADLGAKSLIDAAERSEIVVCDEIGPMELFSPEFRRAVKRIFDCEKPILAVVHKRMKDPLIDELKASESVEIVEVTRENRDSLPEMLASKVLALLKK